MSAPLVRSLLTDSRLAPGNAGPLQEAANAWFQAEPNAASFAVRALFRELFSREYDDEQGISSERLAVLEAALLQPLHDLLDSLPHGGKAVADALDALAKAARNQFEPT